MIDREKLALKLGVENLEEYIKIEFIKGQEQGKIELDKLILSSLDVIDKTEKENIKVAHILFELINFKRDICIITDNYIFQMMHGCKEYYSSFISRATEDEQIIRLSNYILEYFDFTKASDFRAEKQLTRVRANSAINYIATNYILNIKVYFDILNDICKIDDYTWSWNNFDQGIIKLIGKNELDKIYLRSDYEGEIELLKLKKKHEIDSLNNKIMNLNSNLETLENKNEFFQSYLDKYYYTSQIILNNTYFGDNMPFLFNLYNFLKSNNLLQYEWSYFYSCMIIGSDEMIPLDKPKKLNFIGRIFYHLSDYLVLHYKENPFQFIKSKFLIGELHVTDSFKNNHMKPNFNKNDDPELVTVDDFFEKQKKIYLKI